MVCHLWLININICRLVSDVTKKNGIESKMRSSAHKGVIRSLRQLFKTILLRYDVTEVTRSDLPLGNASLCRFIMTNYRLVVCQLLPSFCAILVELGV